MIALSELFSFTLVVIGVATFAYKIGYEDGKNNNRPNS